MPAEDDAVTKTNPHMLAWHIKPQGHRQKIYDADEAGMHRFIRKLAVGVFFASLLILYHFL